jgi:SAM-dependent methyltransferase
LKKILKILLNRCPRLKTVIKKMQARLFPIDSVSTGYVELHGSDIADNSQRLRDAWRGDALPLKQRDVVNKQLSDFRDGKSVDVFDVMITALRALPDADKPGTLLEIGCSSGYYSEAFNIARLPIAYHGCDYSNAFITSAKEIYPNLPFDVEDAVKLRYKNRQFDIVISGCCLLHIPEFEAAISETARVTNRHAIFHRTPVMLNRPTKYFRKMAYGVETVEIHLNEQDLLAYFDKNGLQLTATYTLSETLVDGESGAVRTYVCDKRNDDA